MNDMMLEMNSYNHKVNADFINWLKEQNPSNERIPLLMSHIINAQQVWLERIAGGRMTVKPFDLRNYDDLLQQNDSNYEGVKAIVEKGDLMQSIQYVNLQRQRFENTIMQMFLHLFNHSSYHRGQINQLLVQEGKKAMVSDYIVYNRTEIKD